MKKLKNENGAITMITLVSILFMVSFLVSSYAIISNKVKAQKDIINTTKETYESKQSMDEIYSSYFSTNGIIPISTTEQLLKIGSNETININGKYYKFANDNTSAYMLMNDLELSEANYMAVMGLMQENNIGLEYNGHAISVTLPSEWTKTTKPANWNSNMVTAITDGNNIVPLPDGFYVSNVDGEHTVSEGLVIKDSNQNEFVWIPVENPVLDLSTTISTYPTSDAEWNAVNTAVKSAIDFKNTSNFPMSAKLGDENYVGILYLFDTETGNVNGIQSVTRKEPYNLSGEKNLVEEDVAVQI